MIAQTCTATSIDTAAAGQLGPNFFAKVMMTFGTRSLLLVASLSLTILTARVLGPEARGHYAFAVTIVAVGVQFGNLGLHAANTSLVAREPHLLPALMANSVWVSLTVGSAIATIIGLGVWMAPGVISLDAGLCLLVIAAVPIGLAYLMLLSLLMGVQQLRVYNGIEAIVKLVTLISIVIAALFLGTLNVATVFTMTQLPLLVGCILGWWSLTSPGGSKYSTPVLRDSLAYGLKAYVACLFSYVVLRANILLTHVFLGDEPTGYYSVAVALSDVLYMLPTVTASILFARLSSMPSPAQRWWATRRVLIWMVGSMSCVASVTALSSQWMVVQVFGEAYRPAAVAATWLMPGMVALSISTVLSSYISSHGIPWSWPTLNMAVAALSILLNVVLLPRLHIVGAAVASTLSYTALCLGSAWIAVRNVRRDNDQTAQV
jgi:O-antigen/teichoic acid export membrane protein